MDRNDKDDRRNEAHIYIHTVINTSINTEVYTLLLRKFRRYRRRGNN